MPNPRHSSACDCTCVLTRNRSLSRDSLMLAIVGCNPTFTKNGRSGYTRLCLPCVFCFVSADAKFAHEFLTLFHRPCATLSLAFLADFSLSDSTAPIRFIATLANYTLLFVHVSPKNKMATSHVVQIHTHARFLQSKKWM